MPPINSKPRTFRRELKRPVNVSDYSGRITIKFKEGWKVRPAQQGLQSVSNSDEFMLINDALKLYRVERTFNNQSVEFYDAEEKRLEALTGEDFPDLNSFYTIHVGNSYVADFVIKKLNQHGSVEFARKQTQIIPASIQATPDFEQQQDYLALMGVYESRFYAGGRGENAFLVDFEGDWNVNHEDVTISEGIIYQLSEDPLRKDHGTAVLGILAGKENDYGITGFAPSLQIGLASFAFVEPAGVIDYVRSLMPPGGIMLLEGQVAGPIGACNHIAQDGCVPMEYDPAIFAAIKFATASGIIVVECAGNGSNNLDDAVYEGVFDASIQYSGAILVGAGLVATQEAADFSNYGSRVNLQGVGRAVTAGYGDLYSGGQNAKYTASFQGTSPAAAMVAGVIAVLQSVHSEMFSDVFPLTTEDIIHLLDDTGIPQNGEKNIGTLPHLGNALKFITQYNWLNFMGDDFHFAAMNKNIAKPARLGGKCELGCHLAALISGVSNSECFKNK